MKVLTIIFMIAITMALSITLTMKKMSDVVEEEKKPPFKHIGEKIKPLPLPLPLPPPKRVSRFLARQNNPRAADHCHKDHEVCSIQDEEGFGYKNSTCCNNKCVDVAADNHHCGACKHKCEYTEACCGGKCVYLAYDKRHCGRCGNRCDLGLFCIYGMCDYP